VLDDGREGIMGADKKSISSSPEAHENSDHAGTLKGWKWVRISLRLRLRIFILWYFYTTAAGDGSNFYPQPL
jgi:hypothetical protein